MSCLNLAETDIALGTPIQDVQKNIDKSRSLFEKLGYSAYSTMCDTIENTTALIEKMVANKSWGEGRNTQKGMHPMKEMDLLAAKIDLLMKKLDNRATEPTTGTVQAMDSHMTCEVY